MGYNTKIIRLEKKKQPWKLDCLFPVTGLIAYVLPYDFGARDSPYTFRTPTPDGIEFHLCTVHPEVLHGEKQLFRRDTQRRHINHSPF